ncbi:MAG: hypothetical protein ACLTMF_07105 [Alistipes putredinis]
MSPGEILYFDWYQADPLIHSRARWAVSRRFGRCTVFIPSPIPLQRRPTMNR